MLQFPVPQFVDVEDKIIGPFTLKQFGFVFGGGLLIVALFRILGSSFFFYIAAFPIAILTLAIAFIKFNGRYVYNAVPLFINFITGDKRLIFEKSHDVGDIDIKPVTIAQVRAANTPIVPEMPVQSRLKQITTLLEQKDNEEYQTLHINKNANPVDKTS
jgi:hypothetical protein